MRNAVATSDSQTLKSIVADYPSETRELIENELAVWATTFIAVTRSARRTSALPAQPPSSLRAVPVTRK